MSSTYIDLPIFVSNNSNPDMQQAINILPIANGGTNSSTTLSNNRVMASVSGSISELPAITSNRAIVTDVNGLPTASVTTTTELSYVSGATSNIQTQINSLSTAALHPQPARYQVVTPTTGSTVTINNNIDNFIIDPAGLLLALTINFPSAPVDGQLLTISSTQVITVLTVQIASLATVITSIAGGGYSQFMYRLSNTKWYRVG